MGGDLGGSEDGDFKSLGCDYGGSEMAILTFGGDYGGHKVAILSLGGDYGGP